MIKKKIKFLKISLLLLLAPILMNLNYSCDGCLCTEIFTFLTFKVTQNERPVTNLSIITSNAQTGQLYTNLEQDIFFINQGKYIYFDDNYVSELTTATTTLIVEGFVSNEKKFSEAYEVNTDKCSCHVQLVSGKDEIVLTR